MLERVKKSIVLTSITICAVSIAILSITFVRYNKIDFYDIGIALGTAGITAGVVTNFMDAFVKNDTIQYIKNSIKEETELLKTSASDISTSTKNMQTQLLGINDYMQKDPLIKECCRLQLISIQESQQRMSSVELRREIAKAMNNSKEIKLLGTSLKQFFESGDEILSSDEDNLYKMLLSCNDKQIPIKVLVVNPYSECVVKRTLLESPNGYDKKFRIEPAIYRNTATYIDTHNTLKTCIRDFEGCNNVEVKFYNDPSLWLIITDERVFVQPYQYGRVKNTNNIGQNFVIMTFGPGHMRDLLSQHFQYIWDDKNNLSIDNMKTIFDHDDAKLKVLSENESVYWT